MHCNLKIVPVVLGFNYKAPTKFEVGKTILFLTKLFIDLSLRRDFDLWPFDLERL